MNVRLNDSSEFNKTDVVCKIGDTRIDIPAGSMWHGVTHTAGMHATDHYDRIGLSALSIRPCWTAVRSSRCPRASERASSERISTKCTGWQATHTHSVWRGERLATSRRRRRSAASVAPAVCAVRSFPRSHGLDSTLGRERAAACVRR